MISRRGLSVSKITFLIITCQIFFFVLIGLQARSWFLWIWTVLSFIPPTILCLLRTEKRYVVISLILLFMSQQAIFVFANPRWGFGFGSDAINDFQTASVLSQTPNFELGKLGFTNRLSYSYYPMVHLFSVLMADVSALPLMAIALYVVPFLNAVLVTISLFCLNGDLFGLQGWERNVATMLFELGFYYTAFQSQFGRETFAFPLVLLSFWILSKIAGTKDRFYSVLMLLLAVVITLAHQVSSYLFLVVLALMASAFTIFRKNRKLNNYFFLAATIVGAYTVFVALSFSSYEWALAFQGIQGLFIRQGSVSILKSSSNVMLYLSLAQYAILGVLILLGGVKLMREKKRDFALLAIIAFFVIAFGTSVLLRLSTPADPWSYTYYMGLRGTIWAFLGVAVIVTLGLALVLKVKKFSRKATFALILLICLLAAGKFSQFPSLVTDSSSSPVTFTRYSAAIWLKSVTIHGSHMFVAPYQIDSDGFETERDMAPYAYLNEYFIDEAHGIFFNASSGYLAFIGVYFDQYRNSTEVQTIYSNGQVMLGHR